MNQRINEMKNFFISEKGHHKFRQKACDPYAMANEFNARNVTPLTRAKERILYVLKNGKTRNIRFKE